MTVRGRALGVFLGGASLAAAAYCLYAFDPATTALYPGCALRAATGLACPGCGTLRALHRMAHADFLAAFRLNPLVVLALPAAGVVGFLRVAGVVQSPVTRTVTERPGGLVLAIAVLVTFGVLRNVFGF